MIFKGRNYTRKDNGIGHNIYRIYKKFTENHKRKALAQISVFVNPNDGVWTIILS